MIPTTATEPAFNLPDATALPDPDEVDEEGFGLFIGVWPIRPGHPTEDAKTQTKWERDTVRVIDGLAQEPEEFEELARVIEDFHTDGDHRRVEPAAYPTLTDDERSALEQCLDAANELLDGLDLGVSSLVLALSATGFMPAASCRGHTTQASWSDRPAVVFAGDRDRVALLKDAVLRCGCRLDGSGNGVGLVAIHAPSVTSTIDLAEKILDLRLPPFSEHARQLM